MFSAVHHLLPDTLTDAIINFSQLSIVITL